ncbi:phytoene desaturase family protein [Chloroflexota bacterium]
MKSQGNHSGDLSSNIDQTIIIIGAGIAGLSAGCYAQMNGFQTQIFEMHDKAGGLCTSWQRKGYNIDGCVHGLLGSSPLNPFNSMWSELLDMNRIKFFNSETEDVLEFQDGSRFIMYSDLRELEGYMKGIAPEDSGIISEFIGGTKSLQKFTIPIDPPGFFDIVKMIGYLPMLPSLRKWLNMSSVQFAERFSNPFVSKAMRHILSPVLFQMLVLYAMDLKVSGYPICGSGQFARYIEERYISLGGEIHCKSPVAKILVENDTAIGIELENGEKYRADITVSAADGNATIFNMLGGEYKDKKITKLYENMELNQSRIHISLGVNDVITDIPFKIQYILNEDEPFTISDGTLYPSINVLTYKNMPDIVPTGKSLLRIELETRNDEYWTSLRKSDRKSYQEEKNRVAKNIINILDSKITGLRDKIDMIDVTTPATYIRYTGNWRGSIQGWENENIFRRNPFKKSLPGLKNFFMCGQWVEPGGGVPSAALSGRKLVRNICKKNEWHFTTSVSCAFYSSKGNISPK